MIIFCSLSFSSVSQIIYVDVDAASGGDGLSWASAYTDLQDGLTHADTSGSVDEIWVAEGTYYPSLTGDRHDFFEMQNNLGIFGGFDGTELNREDRDWRMHETIISGDIDQNGILDTMNSNHVILNSHNGLDSSALLDGFMVTFGYAYQNSGFSLYRGGAMRNSSVSPTFRNCKFYKNYGLNWGGAVYNDEASVTFINCIFESNHSDNSGGALYLFRANGQIINCVFYDNTSSSSGGALWNNQSSPNVVNSSFYNNTGSSAGAIRNFLSTAKPTITNCVLWDNHPNEIVASSGAAPTLTNCIVKGGFIGTNIWDVDPQFVDTATRNLNLLYQSPAINVGANDSIPSFATTDLSGNERLINGLVDLGSYEFNFEFPCGLYNSLIVVESPIYPAIYRAIGQISTASTVAAGSAPVSFESELEIQLNPLFEVENGGEFEAVIEDPCVD